MQNDCKNCVLLTEAHVYFGGMCLCYGLYMVGDRILRRFRIRVGKADEFCEADVGCDLFRAAECYQRVLNDRVTPCTLESVLAELQYA